jgi:hypothetical protein
MLIEMEVGEGGTQNGRGDWKNGIGCQKFWGCQSLKHEHGDSGSGGWRDQGSNHANRVWPTRHGSRGARVPPLVALGGVWGGKGNRWGRCGFHDKQT